MNIKNLLVNRRKPFLVNHDARDTEGRLSAVRDVFYNRTSDDDAEGGTISLAEGGCLMRPHHTVMQALSDTVHDYHGAPFQIYPQVTVNFELLKRASEFFAQECKIPAVASDHIVLGLGSSHIFDVFLGATCEDGDIILSPESYYHAFSSWPTKWGGHFVCLKTQAENGYKLTPEALHQWFGNNRDIAHKAKTVMICNPTTTGALYTEDEMKALSDAIIEHGLFVVSDEVFRGAEFLGKKTFSIASIDGMAERTLTMHSGSKTRGTADFRIGWGCGPELLVNKMIYLLEQSIIEIPLHLQRVGLAALNTPQDYLDTATTEYRERVMILVDEIKAMNKRLAHHALQSDTDLIQIPFIPQSGHYLMLSMEALRGWQTDSGQTIQNGIDLIHYFMRDTGDALSPHKGVILSSGYSKGHDDMIVYVAFAQPGYQEMSAAMYDYERRQVFEAYLQKNSVKKLTKLDIETAAKILGLEYIHADSANYNKAAQVGRTILLEAMYRIEGAISRLSPVSTSEMYNDVCIAKAV